MQDTAVQEHFKQAAPFWKEVYDQNDVYAIVHQKRRDTVLTIVDDLELKPGADVLDVGCGAGVISVPLASRGLNVKAIDAVSEMIALTNRLASECNVSANLKATLGDIHHLEFADNLFELVLAIGVLPWLTECRRPLAELVRVLKPGGFLIVNIDNRWGLHRILDPVTNFAFAKLRLGAGRLLRLLGLRKRKRGIPTSLMSVGQFDRHLRRYGVRPLRGTTIGFGPFTIFQREILPTSPAAKLHLWLQNLCDQRVPLLRWMGGQYLVVAQKREDHHQSR